MAIVWYILAIPTSTIFPNFLVILKRRLEDILMKSTIILKSIATKYKFKRTQERKGWGSALHLICYSERKDTVRQKRLPRFRDNASSALDHTKKGRRLWFRTSSMTLTSFLKALRNPCYWVPGRPDKKVCIYLCQPM